MRREGYLGYLRMRVANSSNIVDHVNITARVSINEKMTPTPLNSHWVLKVVSLDLGKTLGATQKKVINIKGSGSKRTAEENRWIRTQL